MVLKANKLATQEINFTVDLHTCSHMLTQAHAYRLPVKHFKSRLMSCNF